MLQQGACWRTSKKLKTGKEKSALKHQLDLSQKVLGVDCDKSVFFCKDVVKMSGELLCNFVNITSVTCANDSGEVQNYSLPIIIDKEKFQLEKDKIINKNKKKEMLLWWRKKTSSKACCVLW